MGDTFEVTMTGGFEFLAEGPGVVTISPSAPGMDFAFRTSGGAPDVKYGHPLHIGRSESMELAVGQRLYGRGARGYISVTTDDV